MKKNKFFKKNKITIISPFFLKKNPLYKIKSNWTIKKIINLPKTLLINLFIAIEIGLAKRKIKKFENIELYFQPHCLSYKFFSELNLQNKVIGKTFVEDGLGTWNTKYYEEHSYIIKEIDNFIFSDLILKKENKILDFIKSTYSESNLILLDFISLWERSNKNEINDFFNWKTIKFSNHDVLILTQPLSEDKICTKKQKKEIYQDIVNNLKINSKENLIIKVHPREKFNYKYLNPKYIIKGIVPSELIYLNGNKPWKIITYYSGGG